jgi:hypothetical protein
MTQEVKMRNDHVAIGHFLQSACATRCIEFRDSGFYCENAEVTGRKFIVDLRKLNFGSVSRDDNGTVIVREGRSLWDCSSDDFGSRHKNSKPAGSAAGEGESFSVEQAIVLSLEDHESGALVKFVADSPHDRAAIGRLCNVYGRHRGSSNAIVKLTTCEHRDKRGYSIKVPELSVVGWEGCYHSSEMDEDVPF